MRKLQQPSAGPILSGRVLGDKTWVFPARGPGPCSPRGFTAAECHHLLSPLCHSHPIRHSHAAQPLLLGGQSRATHPKAPSGPHPWGHEGHTQPPSETLGDTGPKFSPFSKNPAPSTSRGRALPLLHMGLGPPHCPHPNPPCPTATGAALPRTSELLSIRTAARHPKTLFPAPPAP